MSSIPTSSNESNANQSASNISTNNQQQGQILQQRHLQQQQQQQRSVDGSRNPESIPYYQSQQQQLNNYQPPQSQPQLQQPQLQQQQPQSQPQLQSQQSQFIEGSYTTNQIQRPQFQQQFQQQYQQYQQVPQQTYVQSSDGMVFSQPPISQQQQQQQQQQHQYYVSQHQPQHESTNYQYSQSNATPNINQQSSLAESNNFQTSPPRSVANQSQSIQIQQQQQQQVPHVSGGSGTPPNVQSISSNLNQSGGAGASQPSLVTYIQGVYPPVSQPSGGFANNNPNTTETLAGAGPTSNTGSSGATNITNSSESYNYLNSSLPPVNSYGYPFVNQALSYNLTPQQQQQLQLQQQQQSQQQLYDGQSSAPGQGQYVTNYNQVMAGRQQSTNLVGSSGSAFMNMPPPSSMPIKKPRKRRHTATVPDMTPETAERNRCRICNKQFKRPSSLQTHYYSHTGEKIFKCPWPDCGKLFSVKSNMTRHYRLHERDMKKERQLRDNEPSQDGFSSSSSSLGGGGVSNNNLAGIGDPNSGLP
ncbi:hypothetical protein DFJ63DRAFT_314922 [Scheffersomyces coipomensis]|uniref:uncharacterized protein n=1 Tax=Scheffersomyces coipomensis TaxID=1788519 RepID=UPI00315C9614